MRYVYRLLALLKPVSGDVQLVRSCYQAVVHRTSNTVHFNFVVVGAAYISDSTLGAARGGSATKRVSMALLL